MPFDGYKPLPPRPAPQGSQQSHFLLLDEAWLDACDHPANPEVQDLFRARYRDYRDRYILPVPGGALVNPPAR